MIRVFQEYGFALERVEDSLSEGIWRSQLVLGEQRSMDLIDGHHLVAAFECEFGLLVFTVDNPADETYAHAFLLDSHWFVLDRASLKLGPQAQAGFKLVRLEQPNRVVFTLNQDAGSAEVWSLDVLSARHLGMPAIWRPRQGWLQPSLWRRLTISRQLEEQQAA